MPDKEYTAALFEQIKAGAVSPACLKKEDITLLLKLAGRLRKYKKDREPGAFKIAVLGSYSIQHFVSVLDLFLTGMGIEASFYEGEYDGIRMDVLDPDSAFYAFAPDITLLLMDHRDIKVFPGVLDDREQVDRLCESFLKEISRLWETVADHLPRCQIFQTNIVLPAVRSLGNLEGSEEYSRSSFIRRINEGLVRICPGGVTLVDMEYMASYAGRKQWFDYPSYFLTKAGFSPDCMGMVCAAFAGLIGAFRGKVYKCLVMDLDNTLWGGVVGDDGWEGIELDPHNAVGEAYRFFQSYIIGLKERGVLLAVCSKNEEAVAKEPFEKNEHMLIKLDDISYFVANWEDKASNLRKIAAGLNIGLDSLVFVDDNPAEREIIKRYLPQVLVVDMPEDPAYYARALEEADAFSWTQITPEDVKRAGTYAANAKRMELMDDFVDYDDYLKALDMRARTGSPRGAAMSRFVQLINKSNQFNLRTVRYTQEELQGLDARTHRLIYVELSDRFSDYGIISCIILESRGAECFIDTWLMSCRVLKRGVEYLALDEVVKAAKEMGCEYLTGEYIPTAKNGMVRDFYPSLGFKAAGEGLYRLQLSDYRGKEYHIKPAAEERA